MTVTVHVIDETSNQPDEVFKSNLNTDIQALATAVNSGTTGPTGSPAAQPTGPTGYTGTTGPTGAKPMRAIVIAGRQRRRGDPETASAAHPWIASLCSR